MSGPARARPQRGARPLPLLHVLCEVHHDNIGTVVAGFRRPGLQAECCGDQLWRPRKQTTHVTTLNPQRDTLPARLRSPRRGMRTPGKCGSSLCCVKLGTSMSATNETNVPQYNSLAARLGGRAGWAGPICCGAPFSTL